MDDYSFCLIKLDGKSARVQKLWNERTNKINNTEIEAVEEPKNFEKIKETKKKRFNLKRSQCVSNVYNYQNIQISIDTSLFGHQAHNTNLIVDLADVVFHYYFIRLVDVSIVCII